MAGGLTVNVRAKVVELSNLCRNYGLWLGLDTWKALRLMREDGVLERAVWVAPLNEVQIFLGNLLKRMRESAEPLQEIGEGQVRHARPDHNAFYHAPNVWLGGAVKAEIQCDRMPLPYSGVWVENYAERVSTIYDAVDAHFMPDAELTCDDHATLEKPGSGASGFVLHHQREPFDLALFEAPWERACRRNYAAILQKAVRFCEVAHNSRVRPCGHKFEIIVTETYGPCSHPNLSEVSSEVYKRYNADAARCSPSSITAPSPSPITPNHSSRSGRTWTGTTRPKPTCAPPFGEAAHPVPGVHRPIVSGHGAH